MHIEWISIIKNVEQERATLPTITWLVLLIPNFQFSFQKRKKNISLCCGNEIYCSPADYMLECWRIFDLSCNLFRYSPNLHRQIDKISSFLNGKNMWMKWVSNMKKTIKQTKITAMCEFSTTEELTSSQTATHTFFPPQINLLKTERQISMSTIDCKYRLRRRHWTFKYCEGD